MEGGDPQKWVQHKFGVTQSTIIYVYEAQSNIGNPKVCHDVPVEKHTKSAKVNTTSLFLTLVATHHKTME